MAKIPEYIHFRVKAYGLDITVEDANDIEFAPVRHGRWLSKEYMYGDPDVGTSDMWIDRLAEPSDYYAYCSACGEDAGYNGEGTLILSNYCPRCGAKMVEGTE